MHSNPASCVSLNYIKMGTEGGTTYGTYFWDQEESSKHGSWLARKEGDEHVPPPFLPKTIPGHLPQHWGYLTKYHPYHVNEYAVHSTPTH